MHFAGGGLGVVALGWTEAQDPAVYSLDVMAGDAALRLDDLDPGFGSTAGRAERRST